MPQKKSPKAASKRKETRRSVPIEWQGLDEVPTIFSNNFLVQVSGPEFFVTFCQLVPPLMLPPEAGLAIPKSVAARAILRVALPAGRLEELVSLLKGQLDELLKAIADQQESAAKEQ